MAVEERERQPYYTAHPKSMLCGKGWFSPVSPGELCPPTGLNPAHDGDALPYICQVLNTQIIKKLLLNMGQDVMIQSDNKEPEGKRKRPTDESVGLGVCVCVCLSA